jgi:hypothetical protein
VKFSRASRQCAVEGSLSDLVDDGSEVSWRMIGSQRLLRLVQCVDQHNFEDRRPMSVTAIDAETKDIVLHLMGE